MVIEKNGENRWNDRVRSEVLQRVKEERNILPTIKRKKANCIGHIMRRNCLLKRATEGKTEEKLEVLGRRGEEVRSYWMALRKREDIGN
jgi:hypothetical protein